ncbi:leucine-rich repeat domain-containing protein [uncultured Bifidobacterium sp.]|uniref:leucine-rich repeat domain-containing protein n=1 Tax=uncultured Bifidobacterium sp. TaxID=165187 RepID=UPI002593CA28|nr:leucine-rich repeat domain-containing protein [uncultured Bifidobacterium sp.]
MKTAAITRATRRALGIALASALMMIPCTTGIAAETSVPIDAAHFPDPEFRAVIQQNDSDADGKLSSSELENTWDIDAGCYGDDSCGNITSAAGIEYFPNLAYLDLSGNQLKSIDLSHNTALRSLDLNSNQLSSLDLSQNTELTSLRLYSNQLRSVDLSHNTALSDLVLYSNQLSSLDLSRNTELTYLDLNSNQLSSLDVSRNPELTDLVLYDNQLSSLNLSRNTKLRSLPASGNQLKSIDLSHAPALYELSLSDNQLTSIDLSHNPALYELFASGNRLTTVDVSHNAALKTLALQDNLLTHLNLEGASKLDYLDLGNNSISTIDLSHNPVLTSLNSENNLLTSIDLSCNTALESLNAADNRLTSIDLSHNTALDYLKLSNNQLTSVNLLPNTKLVDLYLDNNRLLYLSDIAESVQFWDFADQQFGPVTDVSLDLAKAAPGIDVSRISNVQDGALQGSALTPTNPEGIVFYDYQFSDAYDPMTVEIDFEVPSHTVVFDTNGGIGDTTVSVISGDTVDEPDTPTRDGYTFDGWYTAKAGGSKYDFSKPVTGDLTLYAHWTVKTAPTTITFRDVSSSTPHHEDIQWLADNGISTGWKMADGKYEFRGMSAVVRQDMAAFLRREAVKRGISDAKTWKPSAADWNTFKDVNRGTPHAEDILWLAHAGISTGWKESDGTSTFRGMSPVVRQDMAAFLRRLAKLGKKDGGVTPKTDFTDVSNATPHADDVRWLGGSGISTGYRNANGTWRFEGMTSVYRQDMAAFLHRLDNQLAK